MLFQGERDRISRAQDRERLLGRYGMDPRISEFQPGKPAFSEHEVRRSIPPIDLWERLGEVVKGRTAFRESDFAGYRGWLVLDWEVPAALRIMRRTRPHSKHSLRHPMGDRVSMLQDVITLSGRGTTYEAAGALDFLIQHWGDIGVQAFESIKSALRNEGKVIECRIRTAKAIRATNNRLIIYFGSESNSNERIAFKKAIRWFCKAVRPNPHLDDKQPPLPWDKIESLVRQDKTHSAVAELHRYREHTQVRAGFRRSGFTNSELSRALDIQVGSLAKFEKLPPVDLKHLGDTGCWTKCFKTAIVADHDVPRNNNMKGIRVSFPLMCEMAGVMNFEKFKASGGDNGYVPVGMFTALIPRRRERSASGRMKIQWHLQTFESGVDRYAIESSNCILISKEERRHLLRGDKAFDCYLGWSQKADILLGTHETEMKMTWSGLDTKAKIRHLSAETISGSANIRAGLASFTGTVGRSYAQVSTVQKWDAEEMDYAQAIILATDGVALIYDQSAMRGWLVPKISLLLHVAHCYYWHYRNFDRQRRDPLPYAHAQPNGAAACIAAMRGKGGVKLFDFGEDDGDRIFFRNVILDINLSLSLSHAFRENPTRRHFYATELAAIVSQPTAGQELTKVPHATWARIAPILDAICVCSDLGAAMKSGSNRQCHCDSVRKGHRYLAASNRCLEKLAMRMRSDLTKDEVRLADGAYWQPHYWEGCNHREDYWREPDFLQVIYGKTQKIAKRKESRHAQLRSDGAVVFAGESTAGRGMKKVASVIGIRSKSQAGPSGRLTSLEEMEGRSRSRPGRDTTSRLPTEFDRLTLGRQSRSRSSDRRSERMGPSLQPPPRDNASFRGSGSRERRDARSISRDSRRQVMPADLPKHQAEDRGRSRSSKALRWFGMG